MDNYGRASDSKLLQRQQWLSKEQRARMSLITGSEGVGKRSLVVGALREETIIWCRFCDKAEPLLLEEICQQIRSRLGLYIPRTVLTLQLLFDWLFDIGDKAQFVLVFESFDDLVRKDPELVRFIATRWKAGRRTLRIHLVILSTNMAQTRAAFEAEGAPMLGFPDQRIDLMPFTAQELRSILESANPQATGEDLLAFFMATGGMPEAVSMLLRDDICTKDAILRALVTRTSSIYRRAEHLCSVVRGRNSEVYLSILQLIAQGAKSQAEIETRLGGMVVGGHLAKLENEFQVLTKMRPVLAEPGSRNVVRYQINDLSLDFWFRYIEANRPMVVLGHEDALYDIVEADFAVYGTEIMRRWFLRRFAEENRFDSLGGDWRFSVQTAQSNRQNVFVHKAHARTTKITTVYELDIVAIDNKHKKALIADVEMTPENFEKGPFLDRVSALKKGPLKGYTIDSRLFTLADM